MSHFSNSPLAIPAVSVHEAARADDVTLVDVREPSEWAAGHAPNALHLPLSLLQEARLPTTRVLHIVCRSGHRSAHAVDTLRAAGYDARNVEGGMASWAEHGLPVVDDDGDPGIIA
jgi:rhodanese-related sulfurtransferase